MTSRSRRDALKAVSGSAVYALAAAAGLVEPARAQSSWNTEAFGSKTVDGATRALGATDWIESAQVRFGDPTPDIAENGAVVPVTVASEVPGTQQMALLVAKNPNVLAAQFDIPAGTDAFVSTRIKMNETSDVYALVKADGRYYYARKQIKITIGGCGG